MSVEAFTEMSDSEPCGRCGFAHWTVGCFKLDKHGHPTPSGLMKLERREAGMR